MDQQEPDCELLEGPFSHAQVCRLSAITGEQLLAYVEYGIVPNDRPLDGRAAARIRRARRLQQDLELNLAGVALVLELLDEIDRLQRSG